MRVSPQQRPLSEQHEIDAKEERDRDERERRDRYMPLDPDNPEAPWSKSLS